MTERHVHIRVGQATVDIPPPGDVPMAEHIRSVEQLLRYVQIYLELAHAGALDGAHA